MGCGRRHTGALNALPQSRASRDACMYTALRAIAKVTVAQACQFQLDHCRIAFSRARPLLATNSPRRYSYERTVAKRLTRQLCSAPCVSVIRANVEVSAHSARPKHGTPCCSTRAESQVLHLLVLRCTSFEHSAYIRHSRKTRSQKQKQAKAAWEQRSRFGEFTKCLKHVYQT